jgi:hypothetical protein
MKVKLGAGVRMAGPEGNAGPGDVVDLPTPTAQMLIANGSATAVDAPVGASGAPVDDIPAETATLLPHKAATARPQRKAKAKGG